MEYRGTLIGDKVIAEPIGAALHEDKILTGNIYKVIKVGDDVKRKDIKVGTIFQKASSPVPGRMLEDQITYPQYEMPAYVIHTSSILYIFNEKDVPAITEMLEEERQKALQQITGRVLSKVDGDKTAIKQIIGKA